jgi:hypothetical protein
MKEQIKEQSREFVRQFCSQIYDAAQGDKPIVDEHIEYFARCVATEFHQILPAERANLALDLFKSMQKSTDIVVSENEN